MKHVDGAGRSDDGSGSRHASSRGDDLASVAWVDLHFEACHVAYEAMVRSVGIKCGWRVLDAGTGSGSYLPLLAELVGATGYVAAIDGAPEQIVTVMQRYPPESLPCRIDMIVGSVTSLPYHTDSFDAVWCSATTQYLNNIELRQALQEFRRVVRPGGIVAIKDFDARLWQLYPGSPGLMWHWVEVIMPSHALTRSSMRGRVFRRWLEQAGYIAVWQQTNPIEIWAPLTNIERLYLKGFIEYLTEKALMMDLTVADSEFWRNQLDDNSPYHLLNQPDFHWCECHVVAVGSVPEKDTLDHPASGLRHAGPAGEQGRQFG